ncbi:MAG: phosphate ABC transporter permease PstA [Paracoccaceae bacterium]
MTATIDMTKISARHTSPESASKIRARHWAEFRLKLYGILAIVLAGASLVFLVYTIVVNAVTVRTEYYLSVTADLDGLSERDLERLRDPNPRIRARINDPIYEGMFEATGREELSRTEQSQLVSMLSRNAGFELGDRIKNDLTLIGEEVQFNALLDDQFQMYLKGLYGELSEISSPGTIRIEEIEDGRYRLNFPSNALTEARLAMRDQRAADARRLREQAGRQLAAVETVGAQLEEATSDDERAQLEQALQGYREEAARFTSLADEALRKIDPNATFTLTNSDPSVLVFVHRGWVKVTELRREEAIGEAIEPLRTVDAAEEGTWQAYLMPTPENARSRVSDLQIAMMADFQRLGRIIEEPNWRLLSASDSSSAELAGIWGALVGSFWTMIVTFLLAFPIGVMASVYLEEFAPKNALTDFIEININNLAAVPSIVFGLLGITVLISGVSLFGVDLFNGLLRTITEDPRSTPLAGGVVLALMSLPTIIIASRAAIKAVPPSIRDAALGVGASKLQTATHHVLPLAMPGILTGSIIAMAQALGETAPLIIIGMNSFIQEAPGSPLDKGNVLPSLIYLWNNNSERLFDGKTAAAIVVLLFFLIAMNALAVLLRRRFERRW